MAILYIDADACPVTREAISIAREAGLEVMLVGNSTQSFGRHTSRKGVDSVTVQTGSDSADFAIIEMLAPEDVVVTQDIGLAAMVLGRGAAAVSPRGRVFHLSTIDAEMELRHAEAKHRRGGGRTGGPRPFTDEDREHFEFSLRRLIAEHARRIRGLEND